jgi:hypothetical protein
MRDPMILVVDDEPGIADTAGDGTGKSRLLRSCPVQCGAIAILGKTEVALIPSDVNMLGSESTEVVPSDTDSIDVGLRDLRNHRAEKKL